MPMSKGSKMLRYMNYRMLVTIEDDRRLVGKFMAFHSHMNLVLGDCEEFRKLAGGGSGNKKPGAGEEREDRRTLALPAHEAAALAGADVRRAAGCRIPTAPLVQAQPGLARPVRGVGGHAPGMMQPQISCPTVLPVFYPPVVRPPALGQMPGFPGQPVLIDQSPPTTVSVEFATGPGAPPPPPSGTPSQMMRGPSAGYVAWDACFGADKARDSVATRWTSPRPGMPSPPPPNQQLG
ncbi:unnamed protein product [Musa hybrid cultivar]